jgi:outer membrane biosynthesis protein TonB
MISTRAIARVVLATFVLSLGFALAGCEDSKLMEMFDGKKKLPGERKEVFPGGQVPGVEFGVPPELMKGYRNPAAQNNDGSITPQAPGLPDAPPQAAASAEPPPAAAPEPEQKAAAKPKPKPKPRPKKVAQPKPAPQPAQQQASAPPPPAPQQGNGPPPPNGGLMPWPGDNAAPPPNRFTR